MCLPFQSWEFHFFSQIVIFIQLDSVPFNFVIAFGFCSLQYLLGCSYIQSVSKVYFILVDHVFSDGFLLPMRTLIALATKPVVNGLDQRVCIKACVCEYTCLGQWQEYVQLLICLFWSQLGAHGTWLSILRGMLQLGILFKYIIVNVLGLDQYCGFMCNEHAI